MEQSGTLARHQQQHASAVCSQRFFFGSVHRTNSRTDYCTSYGETVKRGQQVPHYQLVLQFAGREISTTHKYLLLDPRPVSCRLVQRCWRPAVWSHGMFSHY